MSADWQSLCGEAGLDYRGDTIGIDCGLGRSQEVRVDDSLPGVVRLWSRVAVGRQLADERAIGLWEINRYRELVGFKVGEGGNIVGEAWVPMIEVSADEWSLYVHTLARACDRLEHLWTGVDKQ